MTLRELLRSGEEYLAQHGVADAQVDAWLLLEHVTGLSRAQYLARAAEPLEAVCGTLREEERPGIAGADNRRDSEMCLQQQESAGKLDFVEDIVQQYRELMECRGRRIPLQHLTGEQEFMGLPFLVNEHVLIPRQDTETLVEEALARLQPGMRVLDLCTGSGCIAVSLAKLGAGYVARKEFSPVDASDISPEALAVARENARRLGAQVRFIESDLFAGVEEKYNMIVSNPPYIRTAVIDGLAEEVRLHEPRQALDGSEDGLHFYREIVRQSPAYLTEGGWLLLEIGFDQAEAVSGLMADEGFEEIEVIRDLAGHDRVVVGRWIGRG